MPRYFSFLAFILFNATGVAQSTLFFEVANKVCDCLEAETMEAPQLSARRCLKVVALQYRDQLWEDYRLDATVPAQRELLAGKLADELILNCPLLATLRLEENVKERWSDVELVEQPVAFPFSSPKKPPVSGQKLIVGEAPWEWEALGTIEKVSTRSFLVRLSDGRQRTFEFSSAIKRQRSWSPGQSVRIQYKREWRKSKDVIAYIALAIE